MRRFDAIIVVGWSSAGSPGPAKPSRDAIWIGTAAAGETTARYHRTRAEAEAALGEQLRALLAEGRRALVGFDFALGYPAGFAARLTGHAHAFAVWDWLEAAITEGPDNANDRFELADRINAAFPGVGPFWGHAQGQSFAHLPMRDEREGHGLPDWRPTEAAAEGQPQSAFKLAGAGSVGGQSLVGLPVLARLRRRHEGRLGAWPFEAHALDREIVLAEVYPSLVPLVPGTDEIRDELQVRTLAEALSRMQEDGTLAAAFAAATGPVLHEEGWILGVGGEEALRQAAQAGRGPRPRHLANDCFTPPLGVNWTPVDVALDRLRQGLACAVGTETVEVAEADTRVLAADAVARRAHPPAANAAVDGYGFAHDTVASGEVSLPLLSGRAAAGAPLGHAVPPGCAVRVLTGASLPEGVDTVVLQEDVAVEGGQVRFRRGLKRGANARSAGEDMAAAAVALVRGRVLRPADVALLTAVGLDRVEVHRRLRVAVLSTGDELAEPGEAEDTARTYDANRPMLLALARRWGHLAVDLGRAPDDRAALRDRLDRAAHSADAILTSGGASQGDEDHVSALLGETGTIQSWRIAIKPGRPLALGLWRGVPVFGLPGNPVAAFVCTLLFARPALSVLAGAGWTDPLRFRVPAAFRKAKKAGRREYLRARLTPDGGVEVFGSEGSGRISGLSWADGLVELDDSAREIAPGDPVTFMPYGGFGL